MGVVLSVFSVSAADRFLKEARMVAVIAACAPLTVTLCIAAWVPLRFVFDLDERSWPRLLADRALDLHVVLCATEPDLEMVRNELGSAPVLSVVL
jgi:hypothetical protein